MDHTHQFAVEKMCRVLGVSTSGYYKWRKRRISVSSPRRELEDRIRYEFEKSRCTYGSPRIADLLNEINYVCSKYTVARYMNRMRIVARRKKKFKITTNSKHNYRIFDHLLNRQFDVETPATVWVSDITYIHTQSGWLYLTVVIDLADRMVLGWSLSNDLSTANTVVKAFNQACVMRKPKTGFMFHSDRGVQYASESFTILIKKYEGVQSMSRKGNCWDNAVAESFFKTIKIESIYQQKIVNKYHAYRILFDYIDGWYNTKRRHSAINGLAPIDAFLLKSKNINLAA
jgi:transposase InsO family protein